jgi:HlyD family secretion protein
MRRARYAAWGVLGVALAAGGIVVAIPRPQSPQAGLAHVMVAGKVPLSIAAPGRIEGAFETVDVGTAVTGIVAEVLAGEGHVVHRGNILARLECRDLDAELLVHGAEAASLEAQLALSIAGPRAEEIGSALADVHLAEARSEEAEASLERNALLLKRGAASRERFDEVQRDERVAAAQLDSARQHLRQLKAGSRPEEIAMFRARLNAANATSAQTSARLDRCSVRSPIDGTILRKQVSPGELVSVTAPHALFSIADLSHARVRVEVDERDVGKLRVGQVADVRMPGISGGPVISGVVVTVSPRLGRRQVLTGDPAEKSDHDVQEVMVDLSPGVEPLPIGLRVAVIFSLDVDRVQ